MNHWRLSAGISLLLVHLFSHKVLAQEWSVTTADFQTTPVLLRGLSSDGLSVAAPNTNTDRLIRPDQFVSVQRASSEDGAPAAGFTLLMRGGDRLVGEPGPVVNEKLTWVSPSLGKVPVPLNKLISISRTLNLTVPEEIPKQDVVTLSNGDTVTGVFTDCTDLKITVQTDSGPTSIPLLSVKRIVFAGTANNSADSSARAFRIKLNDSSIITASDAQCDTSKLKMQLPGKNGLRVELPLSSVLGIEQLNGPVGWLSSMTPTENIQTPYFGGSPVWPARFDESVDGTPLTFQGKTYEHGIGVHAYSRLTFDIPVQWKFFRTQYAIDSRRDQPRKFADVVVRIKLDGKVVHEEPHFREGILSPVVLVDLAGSKSLTLECDYGPAGDTQAHLNWLEPAFVHDDARPATSQASTQP